MTMLDKTVSRRHFMTAAASIGGLTALSTATGVGLLGSGSEAAQKQFMGDVLDRYTGHSDKIQPEYIELFTSRFTEVYGVVDYKQMFSGPIGEYRLIKLFLKSIFRTA